MRSEIKRRQFSENHQSWFSHDYACWANNHNGWRKMKKKDSFPLKNFTENIRTGGTNGNTKFNNCT